MRGLPEYSPLCMYICLSSMHSPNHRCFQVADLPWYKRKAAGLIGTLPTSSYEEALGYFEAAEKATPKPFTPIWLYLGKCHMQMRHWVEAKKWFTKVLEEESSQSDPDHKEVYLETALDPPLTIVAMVSHTLTAGSRRSKDFDQEGVIDRDHCHV